MDDIPIHSTLTVNDLPVEILRYIVSFLTQRELSLTVAPVCQLWRELAYDPVRWRTVSFDLSNESITSETLENCFARSPLLHSLDVIGGRYSRFLLSVTDIQCCAMYCDKIVDLQLRYISSLDLDMIIEVVHSFPQLESLSLEGCEQLDHKCIPHICDLSLLRKLNISHCIQLMDKMLDIISCHLPLLQDLKIDGLNHISDSAVINFLHCHGHQLQVLYLDGEELTDVSIHAVCACPLLRCLRVSFSGQLTDRCLLSLKDDIFVKTLSNLGNKQDDIVKTNINLVDISFNKMPCLRELGIRKGSQLTADGLKSLFNGSSLKKLTYLDLSECSDLTDEVIQAMCDCCGASLRELVLSWCWDVTEVGLSSIINHCRNLEYLYVIGLYKLTGQCLERVPELVPHLTYLDLTQCNKIEDSIVEDLVRRKQDLTAIDYYGDKFCQSSQPPTTTTCSSNTDS